MTAIVTIVLLLATPSTKDQAVEVKKQLDAQGKLIKVRLGIWATVAKGIEAEMKATLMSAPSSELDEQMLVTWRDVLSAFSDFKLLIERRRDVEKRGQRDEPLIAALSGLLDEQRGFLRAAELEGSAHKVLAKQSQAIIASFKKWGEVASANQFEVTGVLGEVAVGDLVHCLVKTDSGEEVDLTPGGLWRGDCNDFKGKRVTVGYSKKKVTEPDTMELKVIDSIRPLGK